MTSDDVVFVGPYQKLRRSSSPSSFDENSAARFLSDVEEALGYCLYRTVAPLRPTSGDDCVLWLVDWGPTLRTLPWKELCRDHDRVAAGRATRSTALGEACRAIRRVVGTEHRHRLARLGEFYGDQPSRRRGVREFHDAQLRSAQRIVLDLWMENRAPEDADAENELSLARSDRCIFGFVAEQLTETFLGHAPWPTEVSSPSAAPRVASASVVWAEITCQYTQSLCRDVQVLVLPPTLNPIAALVSSEKAPARGHDTHTRIAMLRILVAKIRRWIELLMGLQRENAALGPAPGEAEGTTPGEGRGATPEAVTADARLLETLASAGALRLLGTEERRSASVSSPVEIIRWMEKSLRSNAWTKERRDGGKKRAGHSKRARVEYQRTPRTDGPTVSDTPNSLDDVPSRAAPPREAHAPSPGPAPPHVRCLVKRCRRVGTLSRSGMCRRHSARHARPHPFRWDEVLPPAAALYIMRRIKRRGLGPRDNVHHAVIKELRRLRATASTGSIAGNLAGAARQGGA